MNAVFKHYSGETDCEKELLAHSGQTAEVTGALGPDQVDLEEVGAMYHIRFADGFEADVFADELTF